ncbi:MAG: 1-acyl-sn-glycerol-3-phosphate acyltransferase [Acidimicrobiia bacterium]|nr:1-acyl-sn-glycerol-3-phosphate acyltransferase [Acidimicrobiia bacterium]
MRETPPASMARPPARITLFTTPVLSPILGWFASGFLKMVGWKTRVDSPPEGGFVFVAAPHTSNWDAFYMLAVAAKEHLAIHWLAKSTLFKRPFGWFFRWLGGIPVEKGRRTAVVDTAIAAFAAKPGMILGISPEGTRAKVTHWKSGFYRIAQKAKVPVVPGFLDFGRKMGGTGAAIEMSGSPEVDLPRLRSFYESMKGRRPEFFDPESIRLGTIGA